MEIEFDPTELKLPLCCLKCSETRVFLFKTLYNNFSAGTE